jgi:type IV fimbrial biogenesis protein FimT
MQNATQRKLAGFTLIELVTILAVVATVAVFATHGATAAINASRTSSSVSSLYASLTRARSLAALGAADIVLCPSTDGTSCTGGFHWEGGWIVFPALHSGSDRTADEPVLLRQAALPAKVHLITSAGRTHLRFQPSGSNAGSNVTFTFCDGRGAKSASAYAMANNGALRATTADAERVALSCAGI